MSERSYLRNSILLCGESDGKKFKRTFQILKQVSKGASTICYEACHGNSGLGILKEFYPEDAYTLERNSKGQLVHGDGFGAAREQFEKAQQEYLEPYRMLQNARRSGTDQDLAAFIPDFEIYYGCDEECNVIGTVYIWSPKPQLKTFDEICHEIHHHPTEKPEHKLVTVLSAVESLTKCIRALHNADMLHRDIKPSNFGFVKYGEETLMQTLSMFDINSVCSVYHIPEGVMGTEGYMEPETGYERASNQTDIYAIGAVLFHGIVVTKEVKEGQYLYKEEYYHRLKELVDGSRLIGASEANNHPRLRNILTVILQRSLCEREDRYANCEELLEDIETALYYALPSETARKRRSGEKWVLRDLEKSLDQEQERNSALAMQYHLYRYPLYRCVPEEEDQMNILVIGFGNYGQKFLDICLQAGQILGKLPDVTVVSDDITDRDLYLDERPELTKFFAVYSEGNVVSESTEEEPDTYGRITFETAKLGREDQQANADALQNIICRQEKKRCPHYIFIALGEDGLNLAAAKKCRSDTEQFGIDCVISYAWEGEHISEENSKDKLPVYVKEDVEESVLYPEIERMAFNTHLIWERNLNIDYSSVREDFRRPYNHAACISYVLSLKYKLYSIGINLEQCSFEEAAKLFEMERQGGSINAKVKNELLWMEHRRWVTEKLCQGWVCIDKLEECMGGMTKDEKRKRHVCILHSRPDQKLAAYRKNNNYKKWDNPSIEDEDLDQLDRMSLELHRLLKKRAEELRKNNSLEDSVTPIRDLTGGKKKAMVAFQEWYACLKDIWNGDADRVWLYKGLQKSLLNAMDAQDRSKARAQLSAFETLFYPVLASMEYRDYKQEDVAFIENIPFVLTYTGASYMVIPFATGGHGRALENVAAATVVNPAHILYLCFVKERQDIVRINEMVPYLLEYMKKKSLQGAVEFVTAYTDKIPLFVMEDFESTLSQVGKGRIRRAKSIPVSGTKEAAAELRLYLERRSRGKRVFAVERNMTWLSSILQDEGLYDRFPSYRFSSREMKFEAVSGCEMFSYIKKEPYLTVADMTAFRLSSSESSSQPEFFDDYKELWDKYCGMKKSWKSLCYTLSQYSGEHDKLAFFMKSEQNEPVEPYTYILPMACRKGAGKIIDALKAGGLAGMKSQVSGYTTDSCKVIIADLCNCRNQYDILFSRHLYALMVPDAIKIYEDSFGNIGMTFDNLVVNRVLISGSYGEMVRQMDLMRFFADKGYVINLRTTEVPGGKELRFTYATRRIKELMTMAGKILEIYVYHKIKENGGFDDVVSGFEINWEDTGVKNEFDCIMTKGFQTFFVECKAVKKLEQDYYHKLKSLTEQFGINATAVLVADTQQNAEDMELSAENALQIERGNMMGIVTIWKPAELANIGNTLMSVAKGKYVSG